MKNTFLKLGIIIFLLCICVQFLPSYSAEKYTKADKTWGASLNPNNDIPVNSFKAFYINTNQPDKVVFSEKVNKIGINYSYDSHLNIDPEDLGVYWVGYLDFDEKKDLNIEYDLSWAEVRIIIDGYVISNKYTSNVIPYTFDKGRHKIEVEYTSNYFSADFYLTFKPIEKVYSISEAKSIINKSIDTNTKLWYVGVYESNNNAHSVEVTLKKSNSPVILTLCSYGSIDWKINNPNNVVIKAIIYNSYAKGSQVNVPGKNSIKTLFVDKIYSTFKLDPTYYISPSKTLYVEDLGIRGILDKNNYVFSKPLDGFTGSYDTSSVKVPEITLDKQKYAALETKYTEIDNFNKPKSNTPSTISTRNPTAISVLINGERLKLDQAPYIDTDRVFIPFREILQSLGATVTYNPQNSIILVTKRTGKSLLRISMRIGSSMVVVINGSQNSGMKIDTPPKIRNGHVYIPLRDIGELLGASTNWDSNNKQVNITLDL